MARLHRTQLSIGMRLMVAIAAILVIAWAVMIAWAAAEQRASVIRQAESLAQSVHQMTMANLLFMKVTKTIKKRNLYYEQVYQSEAIRDLRILRGEPVVAEMGEGDAVSMSPDALERQALADGKDILVETDDPEHGHTLRAVFPVRASTNYLGKNCLDGSCHTEPKEGDILGAVSMKITLAKVDGDIQRGKMRLIFAATLISIPFLGFILFFIRRVVSRPLGAMTSSLNEIAHGDSQGFQRLPIAGQDEIGQASGAFNELMGKLEEDARVTEREHTEMTRIKFALDSVSVPVTVQDDRQQLIYMNKHAEQLWAVMEPGLQQRHPSFSVARMANQPIAGVFNHPEHQALFAGKLAQPMVINAELAHHQLMVSASPVIDNHGNYIGSVAQWNDRTEEVAIEQEVERIVGAAARGDFSQRLATDDKDGFFLRLAQGLNQFLETSAQGLGALAQVLNALSRGDLTRQIEQDFAGTFGQLRNDTNATVTQLRDVVTRIKQASETINNTASEIATGNHDLAERTREQTRLLEDAGRAMDELGRLVMHNAENAHKARELAAGSNEQAQQGGEIVRRVVQTMGDIEHSSKRITEIVGMIDSIAFQTNILALNAAVEAARAGEQGRGFAVVAAEVRNLALRSAGAAKEIHGLIADSVDKVSSGSRLAGQAGSTMEAVVRSFQQVALLVDEISGISNQQRDGIRTTGQAVEQINRVTQQNAELVGEVDHAASSLEQQASGLTRAVGVFRLDTTMSRESR